VNDYAHYSLSLASRGTVWVRSPITESQTSVFGELKGASSLRERSRSLVKALPNAMTVGLLCTCQTATPIDTLHRKGKVSIYTWRPAILPDHFDQRKVSQLASSFCNRAADTIRPSHERSHPLVYAFRACVVSFFMCVLNA
jgi:hypothetical protein